MAVTAEIKNGKEWTRARLLLRALRSRNYRLFVAGQGVSLVGTWMQQVAMSWLVYRLTGSTLLLGVVGFTSQIPTFFMAPVAGVLADRWDRRRLLLATQSLAMLQAAFLALAVLSGSIEVWQIIFLSLFLGIVNAFDIPIRQSFVVEMVDHREDLGNAIALNSSLVNGARLVGPSIAGILVAAVGEGICFVLNAASYLAVILALAAMQVDPGQHQQRPRRHILHELREGFAYAFGFGPIRSILLLMALVSLMGMPYSVLAPVFAKEILHGGAQTFGFLMTAAGCGALSGTLYLASRKSVLGLGRVITRATTLFAVGIAAFALSRSFIFSLLALSLAGFGAMTLVSSSNTVLQTILDEDKRGRVMSFFAMSFVGIAPFGNLAAGAMAQAIGPRDTLLLGAGFCLAGGALFARNLPKIREKVRPIYIRMGIIREVADGMEAGAEAPPIGEVDSAPPLLEDMKTVTAAIIVKNDRVLLTRRKEGEKLSGYWEFPGGKVEDGETLQECLERELQEELGVAARAGDVFAESVYHYAHGKIKLIGLETELLDHEFHLRVHDRAEWVPARNLLEFQLAPADIPLARKILASAKMP
ncbi:MFS transporter [Thiovibrio sp. JS02]